MPTRSNIAPRDVNVLAADIVAEATGDSEKNPAAVAVASSPLSDLRIQSGGLAPPADAFPFDFAPVSPTTDLS